VILFGPESHCQGSGSLVLKVGCVVEITRCIARCAHPTEKSALSLTDISVHRLYR
jgi:hypothetical protein